MSISIRIDDTVLVREFDGEIVILDTRSNRVHQLNRTAALIWKRCREPTTPEAITAALTAEFEVDEPDGAGGRTKNVE